MNTSPFIRNNAIPNTIPTTDRVLKDIQTAHSHLLQIEQQLSQTLYPIHFTLDLIRGETDNYSIRYEAKILETNSVIVSVNEVIDFGAACYILGSLDRILTLPMPENPSNFESLSLGRRSDEHSDSLTIVTPVYRMSYTKPVGEARVFGMVRVDAEALDDDSCLEMLEEVVVERDGKKVIEDDGVAVYAFESEIFNETIRLENKDSLKKTFRDELKDRYEANIAALGAF